MDRVVMFSGGVGSWMAARRAAAAGPIVLLFADTRIEDPDLYRFVAQVAPSLGRLVTIADGRTPWDLFDAEGFIGNTRVDICSRVLKRDLIRHWLNVQDYHPHRTTLYLGIDWTEAHRFERARERWLPWRVEAPLCDPPLLSKADMLAALEASGIRPPRLYAMGFPHNNCGGGCVKAGISHWTHLLKTLPAVYAEWEFRETRFRETTGKDVAILRDRRGGQTRPLTLSALRARVECGQVQPANEWGGCGCAVE